MKTIHYATFNFFFTEQNNCYIQNNKCIYNNDDDARFNSFRLRIETVTPRSKHAKNQHYVILAR